MKSNSERRTLEVDIRIYFNTGSMELFLSILLVKRHTYALVGTNDADSSRITHDAVLCRYATAPTVA